MDADPVIWDPNIQEIISSKTHYQNCDLVYEDSKINGQPKITTANGIMKWNTDDAD
jgi:hypothetical protein